MPTPDELEALARQLDARAEECRVAAQEARALAATLRGLPSGRPLTVHKQARKTGSVTPATRHAISSKLMRKDKNLAAAYAADPKVASLRDLADALDVSVQLLSMIRNGDRSATDELRARFRKRFGKDWQ